MIRGLYTAASGMLAMQRRQETLANNLANVNTPGYKEDEGVIRSFPEQLLSRIRDKEGPDIQGWPSMPGQPVPIGRLHTGAYMPEALAIFSQGDIEETKQPYDLALTDNLPVDPNNPLIVNGKEVKPRLFFAVAKAEDTVNPVDQADIRYTRNGSFMVNPEGFLVTSDGYNVLDDRGIAISVNNVDFRGDGSTVNFGNKVKITETGAIFVPDPDTEGEPLIQLAYLNGEPARVGLKVIANPYELVREGNNLYRYGGQDVPPNVDDNPEYNGFFAVRQGWVERANIDPSKTMTDMMSVVRAYEANQRVISTIDQTLGKAVNEIGRVGG
ncbi:flagellar hook-basal body protein [Brevibacillus sp. SYSU BS000544]|uniref:flagellar hook-basal body protein n=1 Tax=Brevibacillus sp. SYSU BS000544 TaxID=3416443 RepID=UPI003CE4CF75